MKTAKIIAITAIAGIFFGAGIFAGRGGLPFINGAAADRAGHAHDKGKKTLYTCGMHPQIIQDHPGNCPICGMKLVPIRNGGPGASGGTAGGDTSPENGGRGKILYWVAPMDPTYIRDKPGKSPMGMDLAPVYESQAAGGGVISIDPAVVQNMGVRTAEVERGPISRVIRATGKIEYDEQNVSIVSTKVGGWIEKVFNQKTGAFVKQGEPLYEIYSPELVSAQREYLLSLNSGSATIRNATRRRLEFWDVPAGEISRLKSTGAVNKTVTITAPRSGFITEIGAVQGQSVMMGMTLFRIADTSTVWVGASLYEDEIPFVKEGMKAEMSLDYLPGKIFPGAVDYIYPYLDGVTRTLKARIVFPNPDYELKPEMFATVKIESKIAEDAVVVPLEAVIDSGERKVAFVAAGEGKFQPREISTGVEDDRGRIQVLSGLAPGERVVVSAQFLLDSESRLREAVARFGAGAPAGGHQPGAAKTGAVEKSPEPAGAGMKDMKDMKQTSPAESGAHPQHETSGAPDKNKLKSSSEWPDPAKGKYVCPMAEDDYYSDKPGKCPKCGMDLVDTEELNEDVRNPYAD